MKTTSLIGSTSSDDKIIKRSVTADVARTPRTPGDDEAFFPDKRNSPLVSRTKSSPQVQRLRGESPKVSVRSQNQQWNANVKTTDGPLTRTHTTENGKSAGLNNNKPYVKIDTLVTNLRYPVCVFFLFHVKKHEKLSIGRIFKHTKYLIKREPTLVVAFCNHFSNFVQWNVQMLKVFWFLSFNLISFFSFLRNVPVRSQSVGGKTKNTPALNARLVPDSKTGKSYQITDL